MGRLFYWLMEESSRNQKTANGRKASLSMGEKGKRGPWEEKIVSWEGEVSSARRWGLRNLEMKYFHLGP